MKKSTIKLLAAFVLTIAFSAVLSAQPFQGAIEFLKKSTIGSTNYIYFVKENKVRIDELGDVSRNVAGTFLVDMGEQTTKSLSHERKLWMDKTSPKPPVITGKCEVKKGTNSKTLQGYKCEEYIVTNTEEGKKITYYLAQDNFDFFQPMLNLLSRGDKESIYFLQIPDVKGMFPMLSITSDLQGKETGRLEVTKIEKKEIDKSKFEIPKEYHKFEK